MRHSVNSIFNPEFTDEVYSRPATSRRHLIRDAKATNYGVVRLELIEHLFEKMYEQKRTLGVDQKQWPHRIMGGRKIVSVDERKDGLLQLKVVTAPPGCEEVDEELGGEIENLDVDLIVCATGYKRNAHLDMLKDAWHLLPEAPEKETGMGDKWHVDLANLGKSSASSKRVLEVGRDYGVRFEKDTVAPGSGVWLQGCCEGTHGVSLTH